MNNLSSVSSTTCYEADAVNHVVSHASRTRQTYLASSSYNVFYLTLSSTKIFPHVVSNASPTRQPCLAFSSYNVFHQNFSSPFFRIFFVFVVVVKLRIRLQGTVVKLNHLLKIQSDWFLQNVQHRLSSNDIVEAQRAPQTLMPRGHFSGTLYWM